ncbi:MAG: hypothetical protein ACI4OI_00895, partial [Gemmiger sp.]
MNQKELPAAAEQATACETAPQTEPPTAPQTGARPAEPPRKVRRVGTFAFGMVLIVTGVLLIARLFVPGLDLITVARFSPVILILLGIEVLIYAARPDVKLKYDFLSMLGCAFILLTVGVAAVLPTLWDYYGPGYDAYITRREEELQEAIYNAVTRTPALNGKVRDAHLGVSARCTVDWQGNVDRVGEQVNAWVTLSNGYQSAEAFAADCQAVMDACRGLGIGNFYFTDWRSNQNDLPVPCYSLNCTGRWMVEADLAVLTGSVETGWWWYDCEYGSYETLLSALREINPDAYE